MPQYITRIRTESGDRQIDYDALANIPQPDITLSKAGKFADAQATGDAINNAKAEINRELALKADEEDVNTHLALKADKKNVDNQINEVKNYVDGIKEEVDKQLEAKANVTDVNEQLESKADIEYVDSQIEDINTQIEDINTELELKANVEYVDSQIGTSQPPYNLLDNSDFTKFIAQAGIGGAHGEGSNYAGDRWRLVSGSVSGDKYEGLGCYYNIKLNGTIHQIIDFPPAVATPCIEMISGTATITYDPNAGEVKIVSNGGVIKNAALYEGEFETEKLPIYRPKGLGVELAECLRYFMIVRHADGYTNGTLDAANIHLRTTLRDTPVVYAADIGTVYTAGKSITPTEVKSVTLFQPYDLRIVLSGTYPEKYTSAHLYNSKLLIAAELEYYGIEIEGEV
jgi:hypothetical protein